VGGSTLDSHPVTSRAWWWPACAAALAVVAGALGPSLLEPASSADACLGLAAGLFVAAAATSATGYRSSRDPHRLFVALGSAVLGAQLVWVAIAWPALGRSALPSTIDALSAGWLVAGVCFLFAWPWRDRRGRPPVRPGNAVAAAFAPLVAFDILVAALHPTSPTVLFGYAAMIVLFAAGLRAWREDLSSFGATGAGLVLGGLGVVAVALRAHPEPSSLSKVLWGWVLLLPVASAALMGIGVLSRDRSEVSRMRRASDRAEEVLGGRAEIASMVAHEVRGPAATVRGIATTTLAHYERLSDDERREFLTMIELESRRLMGTVDQMSLALKIDAKSLTYAMGPQDLGAIAIEGRDAAELGEHPVAGAIEPGVGVRGDHDRLVEVIRQVLTNAALFSPPASPIQLVVHRDGADAVVEVIDEGPGIPPAERERVFGRFPNWRPPGYQELPGTGLGLFICRGIVAEHSGEISVEGAPQGGTILRIRLPAEGDEGGQG